MEIVRFAQKAGHIFYESANLEKIAEGFYFTEGPVWDGKEECLYFTDFNDNLIYRWKEGEREEIYRTNSGRAVGLSMLSDGSIVSAETRSHAITVAGSCKSRILADSFEGKRLNSPNDVAARSDGWIYFTDPYSTAMGDVRELPFNGIYGIRAEGGMPEAGNLFLVDDGMERPNGIAFSPDEQILYVNDTNHQLIVAYQMRKDGTASLIGRFATLDARYGNGAADGMKVDTEGNVYLTGPGGIWVIDPSGEPVAILKCPEVAGNLCFGGADGQMLYITASTGVYRVPVKIPGVMPVRR